MYNENLWLSFLFILVCVKLEAKRENLSFLGWHFFGVPVRVFVRCSWHYKKQKLFLTLLVSLKTSCLESCLGARLYRYFMATQNKCSNIYNPSSLDFRPRRLVLGKFIHSTWTWHGMAWDAAKVFRCLRYCAVLSGRMSRRVVALAHTKFLCCWKISSSSTPDFAVDFYRAMRWCSRKENRSDVSKDGDRKFDENSSSRQHSNPLTPTFIQRMSKKSSANFTISSTRKFVRWKWKLFQLNLSVKIHNFLICASPRAEMLPNFPYIHNNDAKRRAWEKMKSWN